MIHEYDEALLNRRSTFRDPEIQNGALQESAPGLPMHLNGGGSQHVCVYRVENWVLRCFVSDPPASIEPPADIIQRYQKITDYIKQQQSAGHLNFLVRCELVNSGLHIKGESVPYLKIPYVPNSRSLGDFLLEYYHDHQTMMLIAQKWLDLILEMESYSIAHGDLDLSNVLVFGGHMSPSFYLIDFDGMYIPPFGMTNMDVTDHGHTHFQPPQQSGMRKFDSTMDRFSALVIYLSLCALAHNPNLWDKCDASDRNLLLHDEDFQRLAQSTRFPLLRNERHNKPLQLCLDELQTSISQRRMPRSLSQILKETGPSVINAPYVYHSAEIGPYPGVPLPIPVDEPVPVGMPYGHTPLPPYGNIPPAPLPQPMPGNMGGSPPSSSATPTNTQNLVWYILGGIGIIVLMILIVLLLFH
jgi:hypothetical protein